MMIVPSGGMSPFDALRQVDDAGREYWSARDLSDALGYVEWRKFSDAVERARAAARNAGRDPNGDLVGADKIATNARGERRRISDIHLTRYGAYLVAMNGDPRKPEIAAAQTYFAVKTREAETRPAAPALPDLSSPAGVLAMAEMLTDTARKLVVAETRAIEAGARADEAEIRADLAEQYRKSAVADPEDWTLERWSRHLGDLAPWAGQSNQHKGAVFVWYRENGYLSRQKGQNWNLPLDRALKPGWFAYKQNQRPVLDENGEVLRFADAGVTPLITAKGRDHFRRKFVAMRGEVALFAS